MHDNELQSFVFKFNQLWKAGVSAHLDLDTHAGQAWVGLRMQLGHHPDPVHHHQPHHFKPQRSHRGPAYIRRQNRRKAARAAGVVPEVVVSEAEQALENKNKNAEEACKKNETEEVNNEEKNAEEATAKKSDTEEESTPIDEETDYSCAICDFKSEWKNGLEIHMSRKHGKIEQLDGAIDDSQIDDERYERSCYYWEKGRIGISYETYCDIMKIIEESDITDQEKETEKVKVTEARKKTFGQKYKYFAPWK